jgi:hypothetical protein
MGAWTGRRRAIVPHQLQLELPRDARHGFGINILAPEDAALPSLTREHDTLIVARLVTLDGVDSL